MKWHFMRASPSQAGDDPAPACRVGTLFAPDDPQNSNWQGGCVKCHGGRRRSLLENADGGAGPGARTSHVRELLGSAAAATNDSASGDCANVNDFNQVGSGGWGLVVGLLS